jgi:acyl carrier protein
LPQTATEKKLASIWQEVLGIKQVGRYDNFFNLGGHSLKVMSALARIEKIFGIKLSFKKFFINNQLYDQANDIDLELVNSFLNKKSS